MREYKKQKHTKHGGKVGGRSREKLNGKSGSAEKEGNVNVWRGGTERESGVKGRPPSREREGALIVNESGGGV